MRLDDTELRAGVHLSGNEERSRRPGPRGEKFSDPDRTADGQPRARVAFVGYDTLWFNTGTLCNVTCSGCYIESSPKNDRLAYLTRAEVKAFLDEANGLPDRPTEIGFTGGEPFMNPDILGMIEDSLGTGFHVLLLTNAMKPMQRRRLQLLELHRHYPGRLRLRVSLDHFQPLPHEQIRGAGTWRPAIEGLKWLSSEGFDIAVAARMIWGIDEQSMRAGFADLFATEGLAISATDPGRLVLFPEMDASAEVPEISEGCWTVLGRHPSEMMCATSRMVVKHKGASRPVVQACTLLPYATAFEMGVSLDEAREAVSLNHPHCARFCVLGGATCNAG
jgi:hypothetical protein